MALYSNVKLRFVAPAGSELSEAYAKVIARHSGEGAVTATRVYLAWTSLPEDAKAFLERQRVTAPQAEQVQV